MEIRKAAGFDEFIETAEKHMIGCINWPVEFPYKPDTEFAIAHDGKEIFLKYFVREDCTMALTTEENGPVWTDSCVEFFISFDESGYYNFEFNAIGTMLLGFRKKKPEAVYATHEIRSIVKRSPSLGKAPFAERTGDISWELELRIPAKAFFRHRIDSFDGITARANFYKCGDKLSKPHFLSWKPVLSPNPNFHLEEFFGEIAFQKG